MPAKTKRPKKPAAAEPVAGTPKPPADDWRTLARKLARRLPTIFGGPEVRMTKLQREVAELAKLIRERCGTPPA